MSPPSAPRVSVIVVNYNGLRHIPDCLDSLSRQTLAANLWEAIVVDNGSTDGSVAYIQQAHPWVQVIELKRNAGFAAGNNAGLRLARGPFVALLNNDAVAAPQWLERLLRAAERVPDIGGVAGKIRFRHDPDLLNSAGLMLSWNGYGEDRGFHQRDLGQFDQPAEVFGACGASLLLRRAMLDDVGVFDEALFMYYEDLDLAWRARLRGWRFVYEPRAEVWHVHSATAGSRSPFFHFHDERNRVLVNVKNNAAVPAIYAGLGFLMHTARAWSDVARRRRPPALAWAYLRAGFSLLCLLPHALAQRYRIRTLRRTVPDCQWQRLVLPRHAA
jgi:GT2 family glycosyltransferase